MNLKTFSVITIFSVIFSVILYGSILIWLTWPISEISINKSGSFGDSFGVLTSLFSGLAFSGMLIAILLQKEELKLQRIELRENRKEFKKSAEAQVVNAKLVALTAMLREYNCQIETHSEFLQKNTLIPNELIAQTNKEDSTVLVKINKKIETTQYEIQCLDDKKRIISMEIEKILNKSGLDL